MWSASVLRLGIKSTVVKVYSKLSRDTPARSIEYISIPSATGTNCTGKQWVCALGRIRTSDTRFRKPVLYPLSYEGE